VSAFKEAGIEPITLLAKLARLGTSDPVEAVTSVEPLIATIDFSRFGRAPARFDEEELAGLNARIVHQLPFADVSSRLPEGMGEAAWEAIRPNLLRVSDVAEWWSVVTGPVETVVEEEDRAFLAEAAQVASTMEWSEDPWHALTNTLKETSGRKGKTLFLPLRRALTGMDHGPDMKALLPLIGKDRAVERLRG
jgi:glutamyl-tRNA synthetase